MRKSPTNFVCEKCGSCCLQMRAMINICRKDVRRWVNQKYWIILQYCFGWNSKCLNLLFENEEKLIAHLTDFIADCEMWFNPETKESIELCPFLRKRYGRNEFECMVHKSKPKLCQFYICDPKDMMEIIKRPFGENLRDYKKRRKQYPSFLKYIRLREVKF